MPNSRRRFTNPHWLAKPIAISAEEMLSIDAMLDMLQHKGIRTKKIIVKEEHRIKIWSNMTDERKNIVETILKPNGWIDVTRD